MLKRFRALQLGKKNTEYHITVQPTYETRLDRPRDRGMNDCSNFNKSNESRPIGKDRVRATTADT